MVRQTPFRLIYYLGSCRRAHLPASFDETLHEASGRGLRLEGLEKLWRRDSPGQHALVCFRRWCRRFNWLGFQIVLHWKGRLWIAWGKDKCSGGCRAHVCRIDGGPFLRNRRLLDDLHRLRIMVDEPMGTRDDGTTVQLKGAVCRCSVDWTR